MSKDKAQETPVEKIQEDIRNEQASENDLINVADDADMPEPATREIKMYLKLTDKFFEWMSNTIERLSYNYILEGPGIGKITLKDLLKFLETNRNQLSVNEVNTACSFIACAPYGIVKPFMEVVESQERQGELWTPFEV